MRVTSVCRHTDGLTDLLKRYHSLMDSLNDAQFLLLEEHIQELRKVMRFGAKMLNWNSLGTYNTNYLFCPFCPSKHRGHPFFYGWLDMWASMKSKLDNGFKSLYYFHLLVITH